MRQRTRLILNALLNVSARVTAMATQFVIVPFAIGAIGRNQYGIWVIAGQIFAYTRLLDMGLRSAVARYVAGGTAKQESGELNSYVNTAAGYYSVAGMVIAVLTVVLCNSFPTWFDIPQEYHTQVRLMVLITGLTLACGLSQNAYSAVLAGLQRYDVIAGTNMLASIVRMILILWLLRACGVGDGLILLAVASGGTYLVGALVRTVAALRLCEHVQFRPWQVDRTKLRPILEFGLNSVVYMMSVHVGLQMAQIVVGALISPEKAADLNVAGTFLLAIHSFVVAFGISGRVVASRYDGENNDRMLRHLLLRSTRYTSFFTFAGVAILALYADVLFKLWVGANYTGVAGELALASLVQTCRLLTCGYALFWLMLPAYNVVNGMGLHRVPAAVALAGAVVSVVLVIVLASAHDATIVRVAWGIALPMVPIWGVIIPWYCCRQTQQPIGCFVWEGVVGPLLAVLPAAIIGLLWNERVSVDAWMPLAFRLAVCGTILLATGWFFVLKSDDRTGMIQTCRRAQNRILGK